MTKPAKSKGEPFGEKKSSKPNGALVKKIFQTQGGPLVLKKPKGGLLGVKNLETKGVTLGDKKSSKPRGGPFGW